MIAVKQLVRSSIYTLQFTGDAIIRYKPCMPTRCTVIMPFLNPFFSVGIQEHVFVNQILYSLYIYKLLPQSSLIMHDFSL